MNQLAIYKTTMIELLGHNAFMYLLGEDLATQFYKYLLEMKKP